MRDYHIKKEFNKAVMKQAKARVFITAVSASTCAADTIEKSFDSILEGKTGVAKNTLYSDADVAIGVLLPHKSFEQHLADSFATLKLEKNSKKTFLLVGSSVGGMLATENTLLKDGKPSNIDPKKHAISSVKEFIERLFNFDDAISFSTACTSSANALVFGSRLIKNGVCDRVVVAGADSISHTTVQGFGSLGVLSSQPCRPFDTSRDGMNVAEGIAFLCLQREPQEGCVEILGYGTSSDAYNIAHPHPNGEGAAAAMSAALEHGGVSADELDYVNAHGTATQANDEAEAKAIEAICGAKAYIGSTKSITGHTLGAAGALEAAIVCLAIQRGVIPKNTGLNEAENIAINLASENIKCDIKYALSNSFAFGGNNVSILFGAFK